MKKGEYIDYVRNSLALLDKTNKYHRNQVAFAIEKAFNSAFYELYQTNPKNLDRYGYDITGATVVLDNSTNRYYTILSKKYVNLPGKSSGIITVNFTNTNTTTFVPVSDMEIGQLSDLDATLPGNVIGFIPTQDRLYFYNMDGFRATKTLRIKIVLPFTEYGDDDEVFSPFGTDMKALEAVRRSLAMIPPKDLLNNNTDQTNG